MASVLGIVILAWGLYFIIFLGTWTIRVRLLGYNVGLCPWVAQLPFKTPLGDMEPCESYTGYILEYPPYGYDLRGKTQAPMIDSRPKRPT